MLYNYFLQFVISIGLLFAPVADNVGLLQSINTNFLNVSAQKFAVYSEKDRIVITDSDIDVVQPIASITKLMSAMVFLDREPDLASIYEIKREDRVEGGRIHLFLGDRLTLHDLLYTSLIASDNGATLSLARSVNVEIDDYVDLMNRKARELGLVSTKFSDLTGLDKGNVSTAREVIMLLQKAMEYEEIRDALVLAEYSFETIQGREKFVESTDRYLIIEDEEGDMELNKYVYLGGKTGYIPESGYCFVGFFQDELKNDYYVSVLNSDNRDSRFIESIKLLNSIE